MKHPELVAKVVVETLTPGARMDFQEDQSRSMRDFNLRLPDGTVAAVEVTSAREPVERQTVAAIVSRRNVAAPSNAELCTRPWRIRPRSGASIKRIRAEADAALAAVGAAGFSSFGPGATPSHDAIRRAADDLGIFFGDIIDGGSPGVITIAPPMEGGPVGPRLVHDAFLVEARRPDNRTKLGNSNGPERHFAVYVDPANHRVWVPFVDLCPPADAVALPGEMTHAWVFSESRREGHYRVWTAKAGELWDSREIGPKGLPVHGGAG